MIGIIDYGVGNLASVEYMLDHLSAPHRRISEPAELAASGVDRLILPGVGAMGVAMEHLKRSGMDRAICAAASSGCPLLGICLGMQMLFDYSAEGAAEGLGLISGRVKPLERFPDLKIPHVGWNALVDPVSDELTAGSYMYFVHSYACEPDDPAVATSFAVHGSRFVASVRQGHLVGYQFHPEKSGSAGLNLIRRWLNEPLPRQHQ